MMRISTFFLVGDMVNENTWGGEVGAAIKGERGQAL